MRARGLVAGDMSVAGNIPDSRNKPAGSRDPVIKFFAADRPAVVGTVLWVVFAVFRFWQALISPPGIWQDSKAYEAVSQFPFFSAGFWSGARPPLIPFVLKIVSTPKGLVILQTAISVVVWGFLAFRAGTLTGGGWRRVIVVGVVLGFACTETVQEWDWSVLSESLALSALAAIFAFSIGYARTRKTSEAIGLVCAATAFSFARDESVWTVALLGLAALIAAGVVGLSSRRRGDGERPENTGERVHLSTATRNRLHVPRRAAQRAAKRAAHRTALLGLALLVVAGIAEVAALNSHRDIPELDDVLAVRIFPFPDRVAWFADHGMPDGAQIDRVATATGPITRGGARYVWVDVTGPEFSNLGSWIDSSGPSTYGLWLIEHPGYDIVAPFETPSLSYNDANGNLGFYAAPNRIGTSGLDAVLFPGLIGELVLIAIGLLSAFERRLTRSPVLIALAVLGALGPASMLVAWHGESQEVTRHMVEGSVETRLAVLLFVLVTAFGPSGRATRSKDFAASGDLGASRPSSGSAISGSSATSGTFGDLASRRSPATSSASGSS
jgi:hypothetical protein